MSSERYLCKANKSHLAWWFRVNLEIHENAIGEWFTKIINDY